MGGVRGLRDLVASGTFKRVFAAHDAYWGTNVVGDPGYFLPRGAIIATCELVACMPIETLVQSGSAIYQERDLHWSLTNQERTFGDYTPGRWAWLLTNVRALPAPILATGTLGLWNWVPPWLPMEQA